MHYRKVPVDVAKVGGVESGSVRRVFGPSYAVSKGEDGPVLGTVWREATVDALGRDIAVWWWASRAGEHRRIYRASGTRRDAALLLE